MLDLLDLLEYRVPQNSERHWIDPWCLLFGMLAMAVSTAALLVIDLAEHFRGARNRDIIIYDLMSRLKLIYETVPCYLHEIKENRKMFKNHDTKIRSSRTKA
jgi:hypothetical protein